MLIPHQFRQLFYAFHNSDVTIASKTSIVFAKTLDFLVENQQWGFTSGPLHPAERSVIETAYFSIIILVRSMNRLYFRGNSTRTDLHSLFLSTLHEWFSATSETLIRSLSGSYASRSLHHSLAVGLLQSPFHACVTTTHILHPNNCHALPLPMTGIVKVASRCHLKLV